MKPLLYKFIFSNKIAIRVARHICFWVFWYLYQLMLYLYNNSEVQNDFWANVQVRSLKMLKVFPIGILHCYILIYWMVPYLLLKKRYVYFGASFLLTCTIQLFVVDIVTYNSFELLPVWRGIISFISRAGPIFFMIFFTIKMLKTWYIKQWERDTLLKENLDAELQLLKAQIHPHFLFNTLNNIYAFILSAHPEAKALVEKLEVLLRYMINECDQPFVSLDKEVTMLRYYIELEKVRYGNRLDIQMQIETGKETKTITPLLLIPFIENSFKHGASKILKEPWINLVIQADEYVLHFLLTNSKPAGENSTYKKGIGLTNVKKRLELLYPEDHLLTVESTMKTFTVNMQVPLYKLQETLKTGTIHNYANG